MRDLVIFPLFIALYLSASYRLAAAPPGLDPFLLTKTESQQESIISLNAANMKQPHLLKITIKGNQLKGEVWIDKKLVKKINTSDSDSINLAPYLSLGKHLVEISGNYLPSGSRVSIELSGPGVSMIQQSSGNGTLDQSLVIMVQ